MIFNINTNWLMTRPLRCQVFSGYKNFMLLSTMMTDSRCFSKIISSKSLSQVSKSNFAHGFCFYSHLSALIGSLPQL